MKFTIILSLASVLLFSVPVSALTAGTEDATDTAQVYTDTNVSATGATELIRSLDSEYDRLVLNGYDPEYYDLLSESGSNIVLNATLPMNGQTLSEDDIRTYLMSREPLLEAIQMHAENLEAGDRKTWFENAAWFMHELMYAD